MSLMEWKEWKMNVLNVHLLKYHNINWLTLVTLCIFSFVLFYYNYEADILGFL